MDQQLPSIHVLVVDDSIDWPCGFG